MTQTRDGRFNNKSVCPYSSIIQSTQLFQGYIEFGLGIEVLRYLAIFFAVLRYLPNFFAVLRCSEPPNVPLLALLHLCCKEIAIFVGDMCARKGLYRP